MRRRGGGDDRAVLEGEIAGGRAEPVGGDARSCSRTSSAASCTARPVIAVERLELVRLVVRA